MAGVTGLEPAASGVTGQRSNQLSYTPIEGFFRRTRPQEVGLMYFLPPSMSRNHQRNSIGPEKRDG